MNIIKNQAFRIKIAYRSKEEKEEEEKEEKIPGIGRYPMGPTKIPQNKTKRHTSKTNFNPSMVILF